MIQVNFLNKIMKIKRIFNFFEVFRELDFLSIDSGFKYYHFLIDFIKKM